MIYNLHLFFHKIRTQCINNFAFVLLPLTIYLSVLYHIIKNSSKTTSHGSAISLIIGHLGIFTVTLNAMMSNFVHKSLTASLMIFLG